MKIKHRELTVEEKEKNNLLIKNQKELSELYAWFKYYDRQIQEFARCQRMSIPYTNKEKLTIEELDNLAEKNKARINELI